jgi:hypothetical protein
VDDVSLEEEPTRDQAYEILEPAYLMEGGKRKRVEATEGRASKRVNHWR